MFPGRATVIADALCTEFANKTLCVCVYVVSKMQVTTKYMEMILVYAFDARATSKCS